MSAKPTPNPVHGTLEDGSDIPPAALMIVRRTLAGDPRDATRGLIVTIEYACRTAPSRVSFALNGSPPRAFGELRLPDYWPGTCPWPTPRTQRWWNDETFTLWVEHVYGNRRRRIKNLTTLRAFVEIARQHFDLGDASPYLARSPVHGVWINGKRPPAGQPRGRSQIQISATAE